MAGVGRGHGLAVKDLTQVGNLLQSVMRVHNERVQGEYEEATVKFGVEDEHVGHAPPA